MKFNFLFQNDSSNHLNNLLKMIIILKEYSNFMNESLLFIEEN